VTHNPARMVKLLPSATPDGFHSWTPAEVEQFENHYPISSMARLALALLLYTAQRRSDVVRLGPPMVKDGALHFVQVKGAQRKPVAMAVPIRPELWAIIDATPCGTETYIVSSQGKPFTKESFGNRFREWCNEAGLPHCAAHGLRKASAARLAEAGATANEIAAVTGHRTLKEVARYTAAASQKTMAQNAMARFTTATKVPKVSHSEVAASEWDETDSQPYENSGADKCVVPRGGIEPPTLRFSVACSTN